jgi:tetratricopeptide (TPR) repeat protein
LERKAQAEAEHKAKEEMEHRVRAEVMKKLEEEKRTREQAEHKAKEEAERRMREELQKSLTPKEPPSLKAAPSPVGSSPRNETAADGKPDEFATIAVADIYTRTGLHDEALKIYKRIVQMEPENLEARKKLKETEDLIKSKSSKSSPSPFPSPEYPPQNVEAPPPHNPSPSAEKDSGGKKKSNRVGYV